MSDGSDWITGPLGRFMPLQRGFDLPTTKVERGKVPVVYSNGIGRHHSHAMAKGPGVVTGRSGTIGKVHYVDVDYWPHNTALWVTDFKRTDPKFVYYFLQHLGLSRFAGGSGVPTLNRNDAHSFIISIPARRDEQKRISAALTDIDQWIEGLERQVAKRQAIKQGMMQQLLTGRTRLPGFSDNWVDSTLGAIARVTGGGTPSTRVRSFWGGGIPWFTPAEIKAQGSGLVSSSERTITQEGLASSAATLLPAGTVLVTSRASIGNCAVAAVPVSTNQGFTSMIPNDSRSTWFLYYWIQQYRSELESRAAGSTFLEISASKVSAISLRQPSLDEQAAIGIAIRAADAEIDTLNNRLTKARAIKTGMMQQLLTGRTRLPVEAAS